VADEEHLVPRVDLDLGAGTTGLGGSALMHLLSGERSSE
jgi:hypothetical protein